MFDPLISVIVPVYNSEKYINKCLDSLINQTYDNLEIIIIDDGSTDNSSDICRKYSMNDNRIKFIQQCNCGVSRARNVGIENAKGDYFCFIDSDDYLELDAFDYLIDIVKKHNVEAVNYEHYITYNDYEVVHNITKSNYGLFERNEAQYQLVYNVAFAWNKLFSKKLIQGLKFDETIMRGEDSLFSRLAFDKAEYVWFDERPLLHYVQSENSAVRGKFRTSQLTAIKLYDKYYSFYSEKYPELLPKCMANMGFLMITIYFDMWINEKKYEREQRNVLDTYKKYFTDAVHCKDIRTVQKVKLMLFRYMPNVYCLLHKYVINIKHS